MNTKGKRELKEKEFLLCLYGNGCWRNKYNKKKRQSRQTAKTYLGRVIYLSQTGQPIKAKSINQSITKELLDRQFEQESSKLRYEDIVVDLKNKTVTKSNKPVCLEMNQGFMCNHTLDKLINFTPPKSTNLGVAKAFASALIDAGINIDQEAFISIFNKKFKSIKD